MIILSVIGAAYGIKKSNEIPVLRYISYIAFRRAIEMGSLMIFHSLVTYTEENFAQVQVSVDVMEPKSGDTVTSNVLHLTYQTAKPPPLIFPDSYSECLVYLEGRRQFLTASEAMGRRSQPPGTVPPKKSKNVRASNLGHSPPVRPSEGQ